MLTGLGRDELETFRHLNWIFPEEFVLWNCALIKFITLNALWIMR